MSSSGSRAGRVYRSAGLGSVALVVGRLGISDVTPVVGGLTPGEYPACAVVGELLPISAVVFREGHDAVGASVALRAPATAKPELIRMAPGAPGMDRWHADAVMDRPG